MRMLGASLSIMLAHRSSAVLGKMLRTDETDGLTEMGSPEMDPATNATRAGGCKSDLDSASSVVGGFPKPEKERTDEK